MISLDFSKLRLMKPPSGTLDIDDVIYPCYASIKYDGFRTGVLNGRTYLNSLREVDNLHTRKMLEKHSKVLDKFDGELTVGNLTDATCFSQCQSAFGATDGEPDFTFWVFDRIDVGAFETRWLNFDKRKLPSFCKVVECELIRNRRQLDLYVKKRIAEGHEGVILRRPGSLYKFGRATFKTQEVLRIKPMETGEAVVTGFECEYLNTNAKEKDATGKSKRSAAQAGKVAKDTLGVLLGKCKKFGDIRVSGFTDDMADEIWRNKKKYMKAVFTYSYQGHGTVDKPRILKFKGFRSKSDL